MNSQYPFLMEIITRRRSIRRFESRAIPNAILDKLMAAALWAPSAGNRQNYRFLAISRIETIAALARAARNKMDLVDNRVRTNHRETVTHYGGHFYHFESAPLLMAPYFRSGQVLSEAIGGGSGKHHRIAEESARDSVSAAIMNLLLAAHALGLGACWMTGPLVARPEMERILAIPAGWRIAALIPLGYPAESPPAPPRRPLERMLKKLD